MLVHAGDLLKRDGLSDKGGLGGSRGRHKVVAAVVVGPDTGEDVLLVLTERYLEIVVSRAHFSLQKVYSNSSNSFIKY